MTKRQRIRKRLQIKPQRLRDLVELAGIASVTVGCFRLAAWLGLVVAGVSAIVWANLSRTGERR